MQNENRCASQDELRVNKLTNRTELAKKTCESAAEYHAAYLALYKNKYPLIVLSPAAQERRTTISTTCPALVACSFACELYLKTLLFLQPSSAKEETKCHPLDELFQQLSCQTQCDIMKWFSCEGYDKERFENYLALAADTFVRVRYKHEYEHTFAHPDFLSKFASVLAQACREKTDNLNQTDI